MSRATRLSPVGAAITVADLTGTAIVTASEGLGSSNNDTSVPTTAAVNVGLAAKVDYVAAAKNPDLLVTGAVTLDADDFVTSAAVVWPDGSPGTLTITSRDANGAVLGYNITYGSPVTATYTQPTITRNANGAATNVPAIVIS